MSCKYCFQSDHTIEQCKTILCRVCKEIGHPHWLCTKDKKSIKKVISKPMLSPKNPVTPTFSEKTNSKPTAPILPKEVSKIPISGGVPETKRDIQFYLKQSGRRWSDIL